MSDLCVCVTSVSVDLVCGCWNSSGIRLDCWPAGSDAVVRSVIIDTVCGCVVMGRVGFGWTIGRADSNRTAKLLHTHSEHENQSAGRVMGVLPAMPSHSRVSYGGYQGAHAVWR